MAIHIQRRAFISTLRGGAAVTWPLAARARRPAKVHDIAILAAAVPVTDLTQTGSYRALFQELHRLGCVEGRTSSWRGGAPAWDEPEQYAGIGGDVVRSKSDVIFAATTVTVLHLKPPTATIDQGLIDPKSVQTSQ
jgi:hypothetical protein